VSSIYLLVVSGAISHKSAKKCVQTPKAARGLSTWRRWLAYIAGVLLFINEGSVMRAAFLVGCAALFLSACSNEPVQQATAAHVAPGMKAAMSSSGEANCAMVGGAALSARQLDGSLIGMCALPNGKRCSEAALASGSCASY